MVFSIYWPKRLEPYHFVSKYKDRLYEISLYEQLLYFGAVVYFLSTPQYIYDLIAPPGLGGIVSFTVYVSTELLPIPRFPISIFLSRDRW